MYFVYVLQSITSKKYYIGQTDNLERRFQQH
ncbi:MAG: GIY-YIG nuclease family protein, partial [Ignavibacteriales bacterium]|nr:GIY-YIG nuclease family protein [Ignavibacteriales bacterium]